MPNGRSVGPIYRDGGYVRNVCGESGGIGVRVYESVSPRSRHICGVHRATGRFWCTWDQAEDQGALREDEENREDEQHFQVCREVPAKGNSKFKATKNRCIFKSIGDCTFKTYSIRIHHTSAESSAAITRSALGVCVCGLVQHLRLTQDRHPAETACCSRHGLFHEK